MTQTRNDLLTSLIPQFQGLINDAAKRYLVPGKVDEEEVTQECLILINRLLDQYPNCDPSSSGFNALVKGAVYRRVISMTRKYLGKRRNYRRETPMADDAVLSDRFRNPSEDLELREMVESIHDGLSEETQRLFSVLHSEPVDLLDKLEEYNTREWLWPNGERRRLKNRCTDPTCHEFLAFYLGWTKQKVKYHMGLIRSRTEQVTGVTA